MSDLSWSPDSSGSDEESDHDNEPPAKKTKVCEKTKTIPLKPSSKSLREQIVANNLNHLLHEGSDGSDGSESHLFSEESGISCSKVHHSGFSSVSSDGTSDSLSAEEKLCSYCQSNPCCYEIFKEDMFLALHNSFVKIVSDNKKDWVYTDLSGNEVDNSAIRKSLYKYYIYYRHGHLGKGNRIMVDECATKKIRTMFPEKNNVYLGFRIS